MRKLSVASGQGIFCFDPFWKLRAHIAICLPQIGDEEDVGDITVAPFQLFGTLRTQRRLLESTAYGECFWGEPYLFFFKLSKSPSRLGCEPKHLWKNRNFSR